MAKRRTFSDQHLTAYLDGEADADLAQAIEVAAQSDPDVAERLKTLAFGSDVAGLSADLSELAAHDASHRGTSRRYPMAFTVGVGLFCLGLGGIIGLTLVNKGPASWLDRAAAGHSLYVAATLPDADLAAGAAQAALDRASKTLDRDLPLAKLAAVEGLAMKRVQVLGFDGRPMAQIAYMMRGSVPVTLNIIKSAEAEAEDVTLRRMQGMSAAIWSRGGFEFLLIGGGDDALIEEAATALASAL